MPTVLALALGLTGAWALGARRVRCEWLMFAVLGAELVAVTGSHYGIPPREADWLRWLAYALTAAFVAVNVRPRRWPALPLDVAAEWLLQAALVTWVFERTHSTAAVAALLIARALLFARRRRAPAPLGPAAAPDRLLAGLTGAVAVTAVMSGVFAACLPELMASRQGGPWTYGLALAALGAGYLAAGMLEPAATARRMVVAGLVATAGLTLTLASPGWGGPPLVLLALLGAAEGVSGAAFGALLTRTLRRPIYNLCLVAGMALAPLLVAAGSVELALRVAAFGFALAAVLAVIGVLARRPAPEPRREREPVALDGVVGPLELGARTLADLIADGPLVLILSSTARDARRDALVGALRGGGATVEVCDSAAAREELGAPVGGVFVIDRDGRLRLAFAPARRGAWISPTTVLSRLRRLAA